MLILESLMGRKPTKRIDLDKLEKALVKRGIGSSLCEALAHLGVPPSGEARARRESRVRRSAARAALAKAIEFWNEPWASAWANEILKAGFLARLDADEVADLITGVRRLIDHIDRLEPPETSRTELAAALFGSAHALDRGKTMTAVMTRVLRYRIGDLPERELWEAAGIAADRVSAPALAWSIPTIGESFLDNQIQAAFAGSLPLHISSFALQRHPITVPRGVPVLVVENPRLVEAAAERTLPASVIAANGNPSTAVTTLLRQLQLCGASIHYHGDFDVPGIAICRRMQEFGCTPWMMDACDYEHAIDLANRSDVRLERDPRLCGPTPWNTALQTTHQRRRLIVHEEFILEDILKRFSQTRC